MSKFKQCKWVWNIATGETELTNMAPGDWAMITNYAGNTHKLHMKLRSYEIVEDLKATHNMVAVEKQATARVKHHLAQYMKQERKRCASVQAQCKDILKRLRA